MVEFKRAIEPLCSPPCPPESQKLVYKGRILKDGDTLESYGTTSVRGYESELPHSSPNAASTGLEPGHTVHLVKSRTAAPATGTVGHSAAGGASSSSPFPGGGGGIGGLGGAAAGLLRDPDGMRQLMANPFIQSMLSSPDFMRSIVASNPALQALMESNPEVRRALEDPETLRTMGQAAQNPDLHREMLRNADRSLSNIEAMPGGHDALRRMYETVQAPLEAGMGGVGASLLGGSGGTGQAAAPTPAGSPLPNPWSPQRQTPAGGQPAGVGAGLLSGFPSMFGQFGGGFGAPQPAQLDALRQRAEAMQADAARMQERMRDLYAQQVALVRQQAAAARAQNEVTRSVLHAAVDAAVPIPGEGGRGSSSAEGAGATPAAPGAAEGEWRVTRSEGDWQQHLPPSPPNCATTTNRESSHASRGCAALPSSYCRRAPPRSRWAGPLPAHPGPLAAAAPHLASFLSCRSACTPVSSPADARSNGSA